MHTEHVDESLVAKMLRSRKLSSLDIRPWLSLSLERYQHPVDPQSHKLQLFFSLLPLAPEAALQFLDLLMEQHIMLRVLTGIERSAR